MLLKCPVDILLVPKIVRGLKSHLTQSGTKTESALVVFLVNVFHPNVHFVYHNLQVVYHFCNHTFKHASLLQDFFLSFLKAQLTIYLLTIRSWQAEWANEFSDSSLCSNSELWSGVFQAAWSVIGSKLIRRQKSY